MGVDGAASNEAADMISEVHAAWLLQRAAGGDRAQPKCHGGLGEGDCTAVTVEDIVRWGTSGGAQVLGLNAVGRIAPGMAADLAIYSLKDDQRYFGMHDPGLAPVKALLVAGRVVVKDGGIAGLDMVELGRQAKLAVRELLEGAA